MTMHGQNHIKIDKYIYIDLYRSVTIIFDQVLE